MKTINYQQHHSQVTIYECEATGIKIKKVINTLMDKDFIYIVSGSGKEYAITEECADDLAKSFK